MTDFQTFSMVTHEAAGRAVETGETGVRGAECPNSVQAEHIYSDGRAKSKQGQEIIHSPSS